MVLRKEYVPEDARTLIWYKLKQLDDKLKQVNSEDEYTYQSAFTRNRRSHRESLKYAVARELKKLGVGTFKLVVLKMTYNPNPKNTICLNVMRLTSFIPLTKKVVNATQMDSFTRRSTFING